MKESLKRAIRVLCAAGLVAGLAACEDAFEPTRYIELEVESFIAPDTVYAGEEYSIQATVLHGGCDANVHLVPRSQDDALVLLGQARIAEGVCVAALFRSQHSIRVLAPPRSSVTVRAFGSTQVDTIVVLPAR